MGISHSAIEREYPSRRFRNKLSKPKTGNHKTRGSKSISCLSSSSRTGYTKRGNPGNSGLKDRNRVREKVYSDIFAFDTKGEEGLLDEDSTYNENLLRQSCIVSLRRGEYLVDGSGANRTGTVLGLGFTRRSRSHCVSSTKRRSPHIITPTTTRLGSTHVPTRDPSSSPVPIVTAAIERTPSAYERGKLRIVNGRETPEQMPKSQHASPETPIFDLSNDLNLSEQDHNNGQPGTGDPSDARNKSQAGNTQLHHQATNTISTTNDGPGSRLWMGVGADSGYVSRRNSYSSRSFSCGDAGDRRFSWNESPRRYESCRVSSSSDASPYAEHFKHTSAHAELYSPRYSTYRGLSTTYFNDDFDPGSRRVSRDYSILEGRQGKDSNYDHPFYSHQVEAAAISDRLSSNSQIGLLRYDSQQWKGAGESGRYGRRLSKRKGASQSGTSGPSVHIYSLGNF